MATKHELWAAKPTPRKPKAEITAAPSSYETTHPVGSAERFLDQAAKEALAAAAAGGVITPRQAAIGAVRAIAKEAGRKYPDRLLEEAARLPKDELLKRAARAEAFRKAMDAQNKVVATVAAVDSPVGRMVTTLAAADAAEAMQPAAAKVVRQAAKGGDAGAGTSIQKRRSHRKGTLGGHATVKARKADEKDHDTRVAVTRGDTFADILRDSAGFESSVSAQEYLSYVAGKRDRFLRGREKLRDISPGLLREHDGSPLNSPAKDYLNYSDHEGVQYSPILRRADRGFFQRVFVPATKGKIWSRGNVGAEEEISLHPFNTVDQPGGDAGNAIFLANIFSPFSDLAHKSTDEVYLGTNSGVYEQMRVVEFQRALAGLKRRVLTHVNRVNNAAPVSTRADEASQIVRDILTKSRSTYENTDGTPADKDRAVFAMIRREFGDMIPHDSPTPVSTGFDPHTTTAIRAFATLPARARDGDGLHNLLKPKNLRGPLEEHDLDYFRRALNIMDSALPGSRTGAEVDLIDATAALRTPSRRIDKDVYADAKGGDAGPGTAVSETPVSEAPQNPGGPRIVINPRVFEDRRDALCVAFNEAFRVVMEDNGFEPVSEPTDRQRKFFADTAYADDELQLRRTILARIATLDTSVKDPTDEQLEETAEMLEMVMEVGAPQNEWEWQAVRRLRDVVAKAREGRAQGEEEPLHTEP